MGQQELIERDRISLDVKTLASDSPEPGLQRMSCDGDVDLCIDDGPDSPMNLLAPFIRPKSWLVEFVDDCMPSRARRRPVVSSLPPHTFAR